MARLAAATLSGSQDTETHIPFTSTVLQNFEVAIIDMHFQDLQSANLHRLIQSLCEYHKHGPSITRSSTQGWFWDVRLKPEKMVNQVRSERRLKFPQHTDHSFEAAPAQDFSPCMSSTQTGMAVARFYV